LYLAGRSDEAERHYETALERMRQLGRAQGHAARRMMHNWANVNLGTGNFKQALALFEEVMRIERLLNADQGANTPTLANHAFGLEQIGRYEEALAEYALATTATERSGEPLGKAYGLIGQASVLVQMLRNEQAGEMLERAAKLIGEEVPPTHPVNVRARMVRAQIDVARGALQSATAHFTAVIDGLRAQGVSHVVITSALRQRAEVALRQGERTRALADAQQAVELARRLQGGARFSSYTGLASLTLGRVERDAGHADLAAAALRVAEENLLNTLGPEHPSTALAHTMGAEPR
jgi:tetratricopeptide (TPR) repeat protein